MLDGMLLLRLLLLRVMDREPLPSPAGQALLAPPPTTMESLVSYTLMMGMKRHDWLREIEQVEKAQVH